MYHIQRINNSEKKLHKGNKRKVSHPILSVSLSWHLLIAPTEDPTIIVKLKLI